MLFREDGKKLPIGIIPNGSGNVGASGVGIRDMEMALLAIRSGTAIRHDIFRVINDTKDNESIPKKREAFKSKRAYSAVHIGFFPNEFLENAIPLKPYFGMGAYAFTFLYQMATTGFNLEEYFISVDNQEVKNMPGKEHAFGSFVQITHHNKIMDRGSNFPGVINDGLMEVSV